jgi:soluble P-type ATPase
MSSLLSSSLPRCYNAARRELVIELNIPGRDFIRLQHLVCDVNGTLAFDGRLIDGVVHALTSLRDRLELHLLTADTHGKQDRIDELLDVTAVRIPAGSEAEAKADYVSNLGCESVVAVGQGANDEAMLRTAEIGICVLSSEGAFSKTLQAADIVTTDVLTALALLENPTRIVATLRR